MIIGILMALETCLILGTGFTQFTLLDEKPPDGYTWSGGRLTRKQLTSRPESSMARVMEVNGKECQAEGKAKVG